MWKIDFFVYVICIQMSTTLSETDINDYNDYDYGNCNDNCETCDMGNCTSCKEGWYGETEVSGELVLTCGDSCPETCRSGYCDGQTGFCTDGCKHDNFYGSHCNMTCPKTCNTIAVGPTCHAESGFCLAGCINGFYGQQCSDVCQHCVNNTCQKDDGVCVHGCILGYRLGVSVQKCRYGLHDDDIQARTAGSISKPLPVYAVVGIVVGCVVVVVVVIVVILHRNRRRTASRSVGIPMTALANATYETCQEKSDRIYTTIDGSEEVGTGRVHNVAYHSNGNSDLQNPVRKEIKKKTYKKTYDWKGQDKHHESKLETPVVDQAGYIAPIRKVFPGSDAYEVPYPSTSGRNTLEENDANIYEEPDECCYIGPNDVIK